MIRRPPRSTLSSSSAASDVYKRQGINAEYGGWCKLHMLTRKIKFDGTTHRPRSEPLLSEAEQATNLFRGVLLSACMKECNPSGFYQRLVAGSENHSKHASEMDLAKNECAMGCVQALRTPYKNIAVIHKYAETIDKDDLHFGIQNSDQNKVKIMAYAAMTRDLEAHCSQKCVKLCQGTGGGKRTDQGLFSDSVDGETACIKHCGQGCEHFFDLVKGLIR
eukprot:TRINITY_DN19754_c0_g1_i14.p1 TRINITY_DN19754_c0_g1~~TRINITY_DN19754_c0_g1_i14.p1  ORF type:complete len:220 (-),score=57.89 TRINITY_DN19754_c0_g1_i14:387-1046(-)